MAGAAPTRRVPHWHRTRLALPAPDRRLRDGGPDGDAEQPRDRPQAPHPQLGACPLVLETLARAVPAAWPGTEARARDHHRAMAGASRREPSRPAPARTDQFRRL